MTSQRGAAVQTPGILQRTEAGVTRRGSHCNLYYYLELARYRNRTRYL